MVSSTTNKKHPHDAEPLMQPRVETDGGPWATHNMPCCVHSEYPAVYDLGTGMFHPSWKAQEEGWALVKLPRWARWLLNKYRMRNGMPR